MKAGRTVSIILILCILHATCLYAEPVRVGTTYSPRQCEYLGLEWKKTYKEILDIGFKVIRLGAYWSEIEKEEGAYDFSTLDWQIEQAKNKNIPVLLTVGMKAPRWPEYHIPEWVLDRISLGYGADVAKNNYLREKTLKFITKVVEHYNDESIIQYWQVENEPLDRSGAHYWWIDKYFLKEEASLVRKLDKKGRPIVINVATYPNKLLRFLSRLFAPNKPIREAIEICDVLGLNVYPIVGHRIFRFNLRFHSTSSERLKYFSKIIDCAKRHEKKVLITELQAEPWEPGELVHKREGQPLTCSPEGFKSYFEEMRSLGVYTILLWGAEYWYYRLIKYNDNSWWDAALSLTKDK